MEAARAPAFWCERALFYHRAKSEAARSRDENERAREEAYGRARGGNNFMH